MRGFFQLWQLPREWSLSLSALRTEQSKAEEPETSNKVMADTANVTLKPLRFAAVETEVKSQRKAERQEQQGRPYEFVGSKKQKVGTVRWTGQQS